MNKSAIVARMAARLGLDEFTAEGAVETVFEAIAEGLAKEEAVRIAGFGTFGTRSRAARAGRNPRTGESLPIPASKSPSLKAAKWLREAVTRGWQEEQAEPGDDRHGRPGSAGAMLEMSDCPGGVEPIWMVLEPESPEDYAPVPGVDAESDETVRQPWIGGFERGMRLRRAARRQIARSDDREAARSLDLIIALSDSCRGRSEQTEEDEEMLRGLAPELIPDLVCELHAWRKCRQIG